MAKNSNKLWMYAGFIVLGVGVVGYLLYIGILGAVTPGAVPGAIGAPAKYTNSFAYETFDGAAISGNWQDNEGDWNWTVMKIPSDHLSEALASLKDKQIIDCTGRPTLVAGVDDTSLVIDEDDAKYGSGIICDVNGYELMQEQTKGNWESRLDDADYVSQHSGYADVADGTIVKMYAKTTYLVCGQDSDENDFYPVCFLTTIPEKSNYLDPEEVLSNSQAINVDVSIWASAHKKGEIDTKCTCSDGEGNEDYSANDGAILSTSLTTNTSTVDVSCTCKPTITDNGLAIMMANPFFGSELDDGYLKVTPYVTNESGTTQHDLAADGDDYTGTSCRAGAGTGYFINTLYVAGKEFVSSSTSDAYTDNAGENLRCDADNLPSSLCKNVYGKNAYLEFDIDIDDIFEADQDATDNGNDCLLSGGEFVANIELYESFFGTDILNATFGGSDPELMG